MSTPQKHRFSILLLGGALLSAALTGCSHETPSAASAASNPQASPGTPSVKLKTPPAYHGVPSAATAGNQHAPPAYAGRP